jgi:hypothetical protein
MTMKLLTESTSTPLAQAGKRFKAVLITPGQGSSGKYSESLLQRDGAKAFPPGTKAFADHPDPENPRRSVKEMIGVYPEGAKFEPGVGLVSELEPFPHWADFVEALAPHAGLSIYAMGDSDIDGNITALLEDTQNSVDLVAYPGRPGSGLKEMYEAAATRSLAERTATLAGEKKETKMTPEQEALLKEALDAFKSFVAESKDAAEKLAKEATPEALLTATEDARKATAAAVKAVYEADLPKPVTENLVAAAEKGIDVAPLIESAKETVAAIAESLTETKTNGHVLTEDKLTDNSKAKSDWASLSIFGGNK